MLFKEYTFYIKYKRTRRFHSKETVKVWFWQDRDKAFDKACLMIAAYNVGRVSAKHLYVNYYL